MTEHPGKKMPHMLIAATPNILSTLRLLLALWFPFSPQKEWLWLIIAGGTSDFLDGWIARRWNAASWQGGLLDGIADKMFVLSVLITFVIAGKFSPWWMPVIIARDLTVTVIALYAMCCGSWASFQEMGARLSGKLATTGQFILFGGVILAGQYSPYLLIITSVFSLLAALDYVRQFLLAMKKKPEWLNSFNSPKNS